MTKILCNRKIKRFNASNSIAAIACCYSCNQMDWQIQINRVCVNVKRRKTKAKKTHTRANDRKLYITLHYKYIVLSIEILRKRREIY